MRVGVHVGVLVDIRMGCRPVASTHGPRPGSGLGIGIGRVYVCVSMYVCTNPLPLPTPFVAY